MRSAGSAGARVALLLAAALVAAPARVTAASRGGFIDESTFPTWRGELPSSTQGDGLGTQNASSASAVLPSRGPAGQLQVGCCEPARSQRTALLRPRPRSC
jgi:hypothetical protein